MLLMIYNHFSKGENAMALIRNNDGTIITEQAYKEDKNWEGGEQKNDKKANLTLALTTVEKLELRTFENENSKIIGDGARREMFRQNASRELIQMREENDKRRQEGKELINKEDRRLTVTNGVVKSVWRAKEENESNRHANLSELARFNEDVRS